MESGKKKTTTRKVESLKCAKTDNQQPENKWVWILKESSSSASSDTDAYGTVINLRHPNSGISTAFLYMQVDNTVQEILSCEDKKRSWFIGESVKSNGNLKLSMPIDPIFLVLPYLKKLCSKNAVPLDQLLCDDDFPKTEMLLKCSTLKTLNVIADKKGPDDLQAYKYNEEKTLKWLQIKTKKVADVLEKKHIGGLRNGVASCTFTISSRNGNNISENSAYLKYAHGIVSEYIEPDLSQKLLLHLNLPAEPTASLKRKSTSNSVEVKKPKLEKTETISTSKVINSKSPEVKPVKQNAKEKSRAKAATGNKSITSFFSKV